MIKIKYTIEVNLILSNWNWGLVGPAKLPLADKKSLQKLKREQPFIEQALEKLETLFENIIAKIWAEVLNISEVNRFDNFFDIGGHSLILAEAHGMLQKRLKMQIPLIDLFEYPTIATLSKHLDNLNKDNSFEQDSFNEIEERALKRSRPKKGNQRIS